MKKYHILMEGEVINTVTDEMKHRSHWLPITEFSLTGFDENGVIRWDKHMKPVRRLVEN